MADIPFISICIPCYNQTVFLEKTLQSIADQKYRDFEVIVTDDSTSNDVSQLVASYPQEAISYHRNEQQLGSPANWNKAMSLAKGAYIKIMHHDDWFNSDDALAVFAAAAQEEPAAELIFCDSKILDTADQTTRVHAPEEKLLKALRRDPAVLFNYNFIGAPSAVMFRNNGERFDEKLIYLVDVEFYIRLLKKGPFSYIHRSLILNTAAHAGQVTASALNREIQLGEYSHLYNRVYEGKIPDLELCRFFLQLFRTYEIDSLDEIKSFGYELPQPEWYFKLLLYISKLKNT